MSGKRVFSSPGPQVREHAMCRLPDPEGRFYRLTVPSPSRARVSRDTSSILAIRDIAPSVTEDPPCPLPTTTLHPRKQNLSI